MWPFRRRRRQLAYITFADLLPVSRAFAEEMASWPLPIDVIRDAFGLPPRWQVRVGRAWHAVLACGREMASPYQAIISWSAGAQIMEAAVRAMLPVQEQALREARERRHGASGYTR